MDSASLGSTEFLLTASAGLFLFWFLYRWSLFNLRSSPPGPIGFPVLGYLGVLFDYPDKVLFNLSKKYGKIFSLYLGPQYAIIVTDYDIAKEIVSHPDALGRPPEVFGFIPGHGGFSGINGPEWVEQRRFCVATMRNLGMGRGPWENIIQMMVNDLVEEMTSWEGKPTDVGEPLTISFSSAVLSLLIGRIISKKSKYENELVKDAHVLLSHHFCPSSLSALVPWLADYMVLFRIGGYHKRKERLNEFENMLRKEIAKRMNSTDTENSEDLIGIYLREMKKQNASGKPHYFTLESLVGNIVVLFFAGSDTSTSSVHWLTRLMAKYPEIQKKVQKELDEAIGKDGQVSWDDRKRLPYTMAVILEAERYVAINRIFPSRIATRTFKCGGYTIPKDSRILVHSWAVMHDPKYWDNPMEFNPERFILNDGKDPSKMDGVSTFSFGRRNCPGETVALMTIFIYFTSIMQKFQIKTPPGIPINLDVGYYAVVVTPVGQELCFIER